MSRSLRKSRTPSQLEQAFSFVVNSVFPFSWTSPPNPHSHSPSTTKLPNTPSHSLYLLNILKQLQPIGLTVLHRLGLLEPVLYAGHRVDNLLGVSRSGRRVLDVHYKHFHERLFGVGIHRGSLFSTLSSSLLSSSFPGFFFSSHFRLPTFFLFFFLSFLTIKQRIN